MGLIQYCSGGLRINHIEFENIAFLDWVVKFTEFQYYSQAEAKKIQDKIDLHTWLDYFTYEGLLINDRAADIDLSERMIELARNSSKIIVNIHTHLPKNHKNIFLFLWGALISDQEYEKPKEKQIEIKIHQGSNTLLSFLDQSIVSFFDRDFVIFKLN